VLDIEDRLREGIFGHFTVNSKVMSVFYVAFLKLDFV
jgi:hypothetical protein